jgi:hypothetical protein
MRRAAGLATQLQACARPGQAAPTLPACKGPLAEQAAWASDTWAEPWVRRAARESRRTNEAWASLAEPASRAQVESPEWRAERAYRTWAAEAPVERTAPVAAAWVSRTRVCIRSVPVERAAEGGLMPEALAEDSAARKLVERPGP